jgi:hypothetical protein
MDLYDPAAHRPLAMHFSVDASVSVLCYRSWVLWFLGYPDAALKDADLAISVARQMGQAATLMYAILLAIAELSKVEKGTPTPVVAAPELTALNKSETAERRQVTVMFSDLVGSTALSARIDPEDLRESWPGKGVRQITADGYTVRTHCRDQGRRPVPTSRHSVPRDLVAAPQGGQRDHHRPTRRGEAISRS